MCKLQKENPIRKLYGTSTRVIQHNLAEGKEKAQEAPYVDCTQC